MNRVRICLLAHYRCHTSARRLVTLYLMHDPIPISLRQRRKSSIRRQQTLRAGGALLLGLLTVAGLHAQVAPTAPVHLPAVLTLQDAIAIALSHQPQVFTARTQTTAAIGQKQEAQALYYPVFTPTYQYQNTHDAEYGVPANTILIPNSSTTGGFTTVNQSSNEVSTLRGGGLSFSLNQSLFDSGQREVTNQQARRAIDAAHFGEADARQQVVLTVTQDYYQLLQARDLVKVAQAQVDRYQQTLDLIKAQVAAGVVAAKDISQAQADLDNAQVTLLQDQNGITTAASALKNALGVETDDPVTPAPLANGDQLPPLPDAGAARTLADCVAAAYAARADLLAQKSVVASDDAAVKAARINSGFTINSTAALTYQATNDVGYRGVHEQILVTASYPLFDAGKAHGEVRVAQAQRDAALNQLASIRLGIRQSVEQTYATRAVDLATARLAKSAVQAAQVNYDSAVAARKEGVGTVIDIVTAQTTLTQAQNQYVAAVYNFYSADAALQRAIGTNVGPDGEIVPAPKAPGAKP